MIPNPRQGKRGRRASVPLHGMANDQPDDHEESDVDSDSSDEDNSPDCGPPPADQQAVAGSDAGVSSPVLQAAPPARKRSLQPLHPNAAAQCASIRDATDTDHAVHQITAVSSVPSHKRGSSQGAACPLCLMHVLTYAWCDVLQWPTSPFPSQREAGKQQRDSV